MGGIHDHESNFKDFKEKYEKMYGGKEEHCDRFAAYRNNIRYLFHYPRSALVTISQGWAVRRSVTEKSVIDVWRKINFTVFC